MKKLLLTLLALSVFHLSMTYAQDGTIDLTFDPGTGFAGLNDDIFDMVLQPDGKIIVSGYFETYNGIDVNGICRINSDGSLDQTFNPASGNYTEMILLQPDGKIIVKGSALARLNPDGSIDNTFNAPTDFNGSLPHSYSLQSDGKIIVTGLFDEINGYIYGGIGRLNTDGSLDLSFNTGGAGFYDTDYLKPLCLPSGKTIAHGGFTTFNGEQHVYLIRLNSDGSLDETFDSPNTLNYRNMLLRPDGKMYKAGLSTTITRINEDGSNDPTFDDGNGLYGTGMPGNKEVNDMVLQPDGKLIITGHFIYYDDNLRFHVARVNQDGSFDASFTSPFEAFADQGDAMVIQPDGKVIIAGQFSTLTNGVIRNGIVRLNNSVTPCTAGFTLSPDPNTQHNWFALNTSTGAAPITYTWYWGDGSSSTGTNPTHTYSTPGYYNICVTITDGSGCVNSYCDNSTYVYKTAEMVTINVVNQLPSEIVEMETDMVKIYPNPATNILTIETQSGKGIYQLQDVTGKILLNGSVTATKFSLDISALNKGIYLLSVIEGEHEAHRKIVKE
jgi:uncharacterized delta-60 repeat protein